MTSTLVGLLALVMTSEAAIAAPTEDPSHLSVRGNFIVQGFDFGGGGVEVSQTFQRLFAVEGALDVVDLARGNWGFYGHLMGRLGPIGPRGGFTFGLGPAALDSPTFGRVFFAVPELAYDFRARNGFSLALGFGVPITLNDSKEVPCEDPNAFFPCLLDVTQFHRGSASPRWRVAVGYSF